MAIILEGGGREDGRGGWERHSEEGEEEEEVEEAEEQLEVSDSCPTCLPDSLNWLTHLLLVLSCVILSVSR